MQRVDVIILGAGPNGLAMALALGSRKLHRPLSVTVLDLRDPRQIREDSRGTAITAATQNMFRALGLWESLAEKSCEMRKVMVTDGEGDHATRPSLLNFSTASVQSAAAALVENGHLLQALLSEAEASPAITLQGGFAFASLQQAPGHISISSVDGQMCMGSLLIAADGRNSRVRENLGLRVATKDYGQTALSFSISHSLAHDNMAEEHFSPDGVFAVLPLAGNRSSIVWGTKPSEAERLMSLDEAAFTNELQARMGSRLGTVELSGKRGAYPLVRQLADSFIGHRVALIGDAAHAIHPLAGLGLNLGFKDAAVLADCIAEAVSRGEDYAGVACLERYEAARRAEVQFTSLGMDGLNALFVNANPALKLLRGFGLKTVDQLSTVKSLLMEQAGGLSQNNPKLMRGLLPG